MVIGRLFGDRAASKYGPMNLIVGGGLMQVLVWVADY
jgi:hypothetical protein